MPMSGLLRSFFNHFAGKFAGCTLDMKQCLDFRRLVAEFEPNNEWISLVDCVCLSTLSHTCLLIVGGVDLSG